MLTLKQIAEACQGVLEHGDGNFVVSEILTDSRKICEGALFIALRGEKFDGHDFVESSFEKGAAACVVDKEYCNTNANAVIVVEDTYKALRDIAAYYRNRFEIPSVAITGSVGKTSTKDMVSCVLANQYNVLKTEGNFNNEIGLPLTAFRLDSSVDIAVFEMGMSGFGEISRLTHIASPETAIITNIGMSHIEHLGSQENILKAKLEIIEDMPQGDGTVILNGDDPFLQTVVGTLKYETLTYGIENDKCDMVATNIKKSSDGTVFDVKIEGVCYRVCVNVPGVHHVYNALAAILTGLKYNMTVTAIVDGIGKFQPQGMRQNVEKLNNFVIIKDCYNASPTSMKSGLEVLSVALPLDSEKSCRKVAVLADMLELGDYSEKAHYDVGALVAEYNTDCFVAIGPHSGVMAKGAVEKGMDDAKVYTFEDNNSAKAQIVNILKANDVILFKGSRGMRLEEVADFVKEMDLK
ncbi:MAG: UDP-N-acetylmuramoyl-tripeptide--D-alanyl-D-alanine ligase [Clostridia bacterium]|nr:UDP-N-acetylmuramoyl-tripeptide--D-alanyl-D-alanine ligase [Clostridia bacterium]